MTEERKKPGPKSEATKRDELLAEARERFAKALSGDGHNRSLAEEELNFTYIPGEQWDKESKDKRKGRLCLEFNQLPTFIDQVNGDQRKNKHSIKVSAADTLADPKVAELIAGHIRSIEYQSKADIAYDNGRQQAAETGFGAWRVVTDYLDDDSFEQTIKILPIYDRFSIAFDPLSQAYDRSDANYCFAFTTLSKDEFESKYGVKVPTSFEGIEPEVQASWFDGDRVVIAEYFKKDFYTKTIYQLAEGQVVDEIPEELKDIWKDLVKEKLVKERIVKSYKIYRYLLSGTEILEDKKLWPSKRWPIVPVDGKNVNIKGKIFRRGIIRYAKDAQKLHNYYLTTNAELIAFAPKNPYIVTADSIEGYEDLWANAHADVLPYLPFKPDPVFAGFIPQRQPGPQMSSALVDGAANTKDELRLTTGIFGASLGDRGPEKSGRAILARQTEGDTGTFPYTDNADRAIELTAEIILDLIPTVLDTNRKIKVMGEEGNISEEEINKPTLDPKTREATILNDMTKGKYAVTVSVGPSYDTQRQEGSAAMLDLMKIWPAAAPVIGHRFVKMNDWYGAQEMAKALLSLAPPQSLTKEEQEKMAEDNPPQPQGPPPELMVKIEELHLKHLEQTRKEFETVTNAIAKLMTAEAQEVGQQFNQMLAAAQEVRSAIEMQGKQAQAAQQQGRGNQGAMPQ